MSPREDLETFMTPASRALVAQFTADSATEDNNVDMDEVVRQNLADHEAALAGRPAEPNTDIKQVTAVDADLAKKVRLKLDAAADKRPGRKPAIPKPPRPFVGYLVENADFKPPPRTKQSWIYHLPPMFCTQGDAQVQRDGFQAMAPDDPLKTVFRVTLTFEIVEDGSRD